MLSTPAVPPHTQLNSTATLQCALRESRSNEDLLLLPLLLAAVRGPGRGTFLEIGANDGFIGSQSWLLEKCFGWSGLLVEAWPSNFKLLQKTERSPRTKKVQKAVCKEGVGQITIHSVLGHCRNHLTCTTKVPCSPLSTIMSEAGFGTVNFLSLDVEGHEELALHTLLRNGSHGVLFPFNILLVEQGDRAKNSRVRALLSSEGYTQLPIPTATGSLNDLFIHPRIGGDCRLPWASARHLAKQEKHWLLPLLETWQLTDDPYRKIMPKEAFLARVFQGFPTSLILSLRCGTSEMRLTRDR